MGSKKIIGLYPAVRWEQFLLKLNWGEHEMRIIYGWSDFTKSLASGIATVTKPRLI
jgi:hypothetical protein